MPNATTPDPTPRHADDDVHDTDAIPTRSLWATTDHFDPSHRAIRPVVPASSTATHQRLDVHDTDTRSVKLGGIRVADHRLPFQRSAPEPPTTTQKRRDGQATLTHPAAGAAAL